MAKFNTPEIKAPNIKAAGVKANEGSVSAEPVSNIQAPTIELPKIDINNIDTHIATAKADIDNLVNIAKTDPNISEAELESRFETLATEKIFPLVDAVGIKTNGVDGFSHIEFDLRNGDKAIEDFTPAQQSVINLSQRTWQEAGINQQMLHNMTNNSNLDIIKDTYYHPAVTEEMNEKGMAELYGPDAKANCMSPFSNSRATTLNYMAKNTGKITRDKLDTNWARTWALYMARSYSNQSVVRQFAQYQKSIINASQTGDTAGNSTLGAENGIAYDDAGLMQAITEEGGLAQVYKENEEAKANMRELAHQLALKEREQAVRENTIQENENGEVKSEKELEQEDKQAKKEVKKLRKELTKYTNKKVDIVGAIDKARKGGKIEAVAFGRTHGTTRASLGTDRQRASYMTYTWGGKNCNVYENAGLFTAQIAPTMGKMMTGDILRRADEWVLPDNTIDPAKLTDVLRERIFDNQANSGFGGISLTRGQRNYMCNKTVNEIVNIFEAYAGDDIRIATKIEECVANLYMWGGKQAFDNVTYSFKATENWEKTTINNCWETLNKTMSIQDAKGMVFDTIQSVMYSNALGGIINRGCIQNITETGAMIQMSGVNMPQLLASLKAMTHKQFKEDMMIYGRALGMNNTMLDSLSSRECYGYMQGMLDEGTAEGNALLQGAKNIGEQTLEGIQKVSRVTTLPFDWSQRMSVVMYIEAAKQMADAKNLQGADLSAFVIDKVVRLSIGSDMFSAMRWSRSTIGRLTSMFWNWSIRDATRMLDFVDNTSGVGGKAIIIGEWLGSKLLTWILCTSFLGYSFSDAMNLNPFGVFDKYSHFDRLSEEDKKGIIGQTTQILDFIPTPYMLSPIVDVYYDLVEARNEDDKYKGIEKTRDWGEVFTDMETMESVLCGFLTNFVPAGGFITRQSKNLDAWTTGYVNSTAGYKKFEAPSEDDFFNWLRAFIAGQNATEKGQEYNGDANFLQALFKNGPEGVVKELGKLQNDELIGTVLALADKSELEDLQKFAIDHSKELGLSIPWRYLTPGEPGSNFNGDYNDKAVWSQEMLKLEKEHQSILTDTIALQDKINSPYYTDDEKKEYKEQYDTIISEFSLKIQHLMLSYVDAGNTITSSNLAGIKKLLAFGENGSDTRYQEQVINYAKQNLPNIEGTGTEDILEQAQLYNQTYGVPDQAIADMKATFGKGTDMKKLYSETWDKINAIYNRATSEGRQPSNAEYDEMDKLREDYMKEFDKAIKPTLQKYGSTILANDKVIAEVEDYVIMPRSWWTESKTTSKKGKVYTQYLSTTKFPNVKADVQKILLTRYGVSKQNQTSTPFSSSKALTTEIKDIETLINRGSITRAKAKAKQALDKVQRGTWYASDSDKQYLINVVK